jgi:hypothetical protein
LLLLALVFVPPPASAQPTAGIHVTSHQVSLEETGSGIDVEEILAFRIESAADFEGNVTMFVPAGSGSFSARATSGSSSFDVPGERVVLEPGVNAADQPRLVVSLGADLGNVSDGQAVNLTVFYSVAGVSSFTKSLWDPADSFALFLAPRPGSDPFVVGIDAPLMEVGDGRWHAAVSDVPSHYHFAATFRPEAPPVQDLTKYVWALAGVVLGLFVMYVIVKQGWVTIRRQKKFEKGGAVESSSMLEARRRTLMAALKELETAHDAKQVPDDAYAPLKEEYKAQAVRVLRSLEGKKEKSKE